MQDDLIAKPVGWYVSAIIDAIQSYCWSCNSLSQVSLAVNRWSEIAFDEDNIVLSDSL